MPTEAIILAGGKAERLGDAAEGRPKALVPIAGRPLTAYQLALLANGGVERVIISCAAGAEDAFERELGGLGLEVVAVGEPERLGRGGGLRFAAKARRSEGPIYALNGDELWDVDTRALFDAHRERGGVATITVAPLQSHLGVVDVDEADVVRAFREAPRLPYWVNIGLYVLEEEAIARLPARGDHEETTFPELAGEGRLRAFRHEGLWLTVNTPKDLRRAQEFVESHPQLLAVA
ncbi:MAG TPA: nucleotidyltransferase family protein [Gaiellaceae bacterium]|jgi:NDP-sugar pyrophosphorylase family protein|nr:nucleotidyltransferase family protein [Gaiellaceae bacterium]